MHDDNRSLLSALVFPFLVAACAGPVESSTVELAGDAQLRTMGVVGYAPSIGDARSMSLVDAAGEPVGFVDADARSVAVCAGEAPRCVSMWRADGRMVFSADDAGEAEVEVGLDAATTREALGSLEPQLSLLDGVLNDLPEITRPVATSGDASDPCLVPCGRCAITRSDDHCSACWQCMQNNDEEDECDPDTAPDGCECPAELSEEECEGELGLGGGAPTRL